jgi:hypothetical protein
MLLVVQINKARLLLYLIGYGSTDRMKNDRSLFHAKNQPCREYVITTNGDKINVAGVSYTIYLIIS